MGEVIDISPDHDPIILARKMVERAPGTRAALAVLVDDDGSLWYEMAGYEKAYLMWALQRMVSMLMKDEIE